MNAARLLALLTPVLLGIALMLAFAIAATLAARLAALLAIRVLPHLLEYAANATAVLALTLLWYATAAPRLTTPIDDGLYALGLAAYIHVIAPVVRRLARPAVAVERNRARSRSEHVFLAPLAGRMARRLEPARGPVPLKRF